MMKFRLLVALAVGSLLYTGYAQPVLANDQPDFVKAEQLREEEIDLRNRLAQEVSEKHHLARLKADELMAERKFGLARYEVRQAQEMLAHHRREIADLIFAFLYTLGQAKLSAIDEQELAYLRRRESKRHQAKLASEVPVVPEARPSRSPAESTKGVAEPIVKPLAHRPIPRSTVIAQPAERSMRLLIRRAQYENDSLEEVLDDLREKTGANIVANWQSLANVGIEKTTLVNLVVENVSAGRILKLILDNLSTQWASISYVIQDNVVVIASSEDLARIVTTRVYDITHLMMETKDRRSGSLFEPGGQGGGRRDRGGRGSGDRTRSRDGGGTRTGTSVRSRGTDTAQSRRELIATRLLELVRAVAPADSWRENGGPGTVSIYGTRLVVTQTAQNQEKISKTLAMLGW